MPPETAAGAVAPQDRDSSAVAHSIIDSDVALAAHPESQPNSDALESALTFNQVTFGFPTIDVLSEEQEGQLSDNSGEDLRPLSSDADELDELQEVVCLPRTLHDRPRRLLPGFGAGLLSLTMKGALSLVNRSTPRYSTYSLVLRSSFLAEMSPSQEA